MTIDQRLSTALADRYRIERELGQGGMATVYLAEDLKHGRKVAIKVLRPELAAVIGAERFLAEIKTTANLQHPHILPLHDSGLADGFLFYVMPFVEGESLRQRLAREGELPVGDTLRIMSEVADALAYAHRHGVVHRDIKPDNVLLAERHALVADFGIAKAVTRATSAERLTETGMSIGTPLYMSPEQAAADPQVDHRADIYSLGVLGYEMLTGAPPFQGLSAQQVLAAKVTQEADAVAVRRPAVPPRLNEIITKCLERRPADRYPNAEELLADLEGIVTPGGGTAPTVTTSIETKPWRRPLALLAGTAAAGLLLAGAWTWLRRPFTLTTSNAVPVTTEPGVEFQPALSPDGSMIAYVAQRNGRDLVAVRSTRIATGGEVRPAEADHGDQLFPSWSPDGEFVRFVEGKTSQWEDLRDFAWRQVGRLGGPTQPVTLPRTSEWTAWSGDGKRVAIAAHDSLFIYGARDTTVREVGNSVDLNSVTWSPDGQWIAYVTGNGAWRFRPNTSTSTIWMMSIAGQEPIEVAGGGFLNVSPVWLDPRHLLWVSNKEGPREVYVVEVSGKGVRGTPQKVPGGTDAHTISVSADGKRMAVAKFTARQNVLSFPLYRSQLLFLRDGRPVTSGTQIVETH
ncbi:MAG TPA: protein kinase, partial [Gemmatimonadales bacterium]|nr:protein kinase [Gemmatimonadales bacterium]